MEEHNINLMRYIDNEMSDRERLDFEEHLKTCETCRSLLREMAAVKEVTDQVRIANLPEAVWERYWTGIYNRLERGVAWMFFILGSVMLALYGVYQVVTDPDISSFVRLGLILMGIGFAVLLLSTVREKMTVNRVDRYISEVKR